MKITVVIFSITVCSMTSSFINSRSASAILMALNELYEHNLQQFKLETGLICTEKIIIILFCTEATVSTEMVCFRSISVVTLLSNDGICYQGTDPYLCVCDESPHYGMSLLSACCMRCHGCKSRTLRKHMIARWTFTVHIF